jgi:hypothetical protein
MPRTFAAAVLLAALALLPSGKMVLFQDDVARAIQRYRKAQYEETRVELLKTLARTRDARVPDDHPLKAYYADPERRLERDRQG